MTDSRRSTEPPSSPPGIGALCPCRRTQVVDSPMPSADLGQRETIFVFFVYADGMSVLEHAVMPPANGDPQILRLIDALADEGGLSLVGAGEAIVLPTEVVNALRQVLVAMADGRAVTVSPHETILTTQQAAELLGVSRPTLVNLLEAGQIPFTKPGRHRRVTLANLVAYQRAQTSVRRRALHAMAVEAAEHDGYGEVNGFVQTR